VRLSQGGGAPGVGRGALCPTVDKLKRYYYYYYYYYYLLRPKTAQHVIITKTEKKQKLNTQKIKKLKQIAQWNNFLATEIAKEQMFVAIGYMAHSSNFIILILWSLVVKYLW